MVPVLAHSQSQGFRRFSLIARNAHSLYPQFGFTSWPRQRDRRLQRVDSEII
jgi:hypothetical protein